MAIKNTNAILFQNSVALDTNIRLVKSKKKEDNLNNSDQIPYGGIMIIVQYGDTRYVKITDGAKTFAEIPKDGEGGSGGGNADTLNGESGSYYLNRVNHTGTQPFTTLSGTATVAQIPTLPISKTTGLQTALDGKATAAQGALADTALQPGDDVLWDDVTGVPVALTAAQAAATPSIRAIGTTATTAAAGNHTHSAATTGAPGFMSAADKTKLDGISAGANVGVTSLQEGGAGTVVNNILVFANGTLPDPGERLSTTVYIELA